MRDPLIFRVPARVAECSSPSTVKALLDAKYGPQGITVGLSVRCHSGSGSITLRDAADKDETFDLTGVGDSVDLQHVEITALDPGLVVKVFA